VLAERQKQKSHCCQVLLARTQQAQQEGWMQEPRQTEKQEQEQAHLSWQQQQE
jgi:hypothetical protein